MATSRCELPIISKILGIFSLCFLLSSCTAVTVVGAVAGAAVTVGTVAVKGTAAVVDMAIPDGDDDEEQEDGPEASIEQ